MSAMSMHDVAGNARPTCIVQTCRREWLYAIVSCIQSRVACGEQGSEELSRLTAAAASDFEQQVATGLLARLKVEQALAKSRFAAQVCCVMNAEAPADLAPHPLAAALKAKELLEDSYAQTWTVERLARRVGCNRTDLERAFRRVCSCTIHRYHTMCRIEAAKKALRETPWLRLSVIGESVGYRSKMSLFANFRRLVCLTPDEYRKGWVMRPVDASIERALRRALAGGEMHIPRSVPAVSTPVHDLAGSTKPAA